MQLEKHVPPPDVGERAPRATQPSPGAPPKPEAFLGALRSLDELLARAINGTDRKFGPVGRARELGTVADA